MQRASFVGWGFAGLATMVAVIGCAVGTVDDNVDDTSSLTSIPVEAGSDGNSVKLPPPPSDTDAGDEDAGSDASAPVTDGGGTPDSGPTVDLCKAATACSGATDLGSISGDENADQKTATGYGSQWLKITVNETDNSTFGNDEHATFNLTSPAGENFDLYVYRSGDTSNLSCTTATSSSTNASALDTVDMSWGEGGVFSNGSSDSALVTIEVRHVGTGACAATAKWTLTVNGN